MTEEPKFVVWGYGARSKLVTSWLGISRIVAYIESDEKKIINCGKEGHPIVSFGDYLKSYSMYPVIITPSSHEVEIQEILNQNNIYWHFRLSTNFGIEAVLRQAPMDVLYDKVRSNEIIYVYGFSLVAFVLHDFILKKGKKCELILQDSCCEQLKKFVEKDINWDICNEIQENSAVILSMDLEERDENLFQKAKVRYHDWHNLGSRLDLYGNSRIQKFHNIHRGKRCFVVATGPSLTSEDLDTLYKNNEICISMNAIMYGLANTKWRPTYYVISDPNGMFYYKKDILKLEAEAKFISDIAWNFTQDEVSDNMYRWHFIRESFDDSFPKFSSDFSLGAYYGSTVAYEGGLQLAAYMGFSEIYLLGTDLSKGGKTYHFYDEANLSFGFRSVVNKSYSRIIKSYLSAKKYADEHNIKIYNATRGGYLEVFERVNFDSLFTDRVLY